MGFIGCKGLGPFGSDSSKRRPADRGGFGSQDSVSRGLVGDDQPAALKTRVQGLLGFSPKPLIF